MRLLAANIDDVSVDVPYQQNLLLVGVITTFAFTTCVRVEKRERDR